jgi:hypothetical protein
VEISLIGVTIVPRHHTSTLWMVVEDLTLKLPMSTVFINAL